MNICLIVQRAPGHAVGGMVGTYATELPRHLDKAGHSVFVLASKQGQAPPGKSQDVGGVTVIQLRRLSLPIMKTIVTNFLVVSTLVRLHRASRLEVIQVEDFFSTVFFYLLKKHLLLDCLVVQSMHAAYCYEILYGGRYKASQCRNRLKRLWIMAWTYVGYAIARAVQALGLRRCDLVIADSRFDKAQVRHFFGRSVADKVEVLPIGIDVERFSPPDNQRAVRQRLGLPLDRTIILTVRRQVPRMGLPALIRAVEQVRSGWPQVFLCIVGDGPLRQQLEQLTEELDLEESVRFAGYVSDGDLVEYYRAANVFVLPTQELEGFGIVTLEALASGLPVLGTRKGATPEILRPLSSELVINSTQVGAIAERLELWLRDSSRFPSSAECRAYAARSFSWHIVIARYQALLERAMTHRLG